MYSVQLYVVDIRISLCVKFVCHTGDGETHTGWGERFEHPTKTWACATHKQFTMQMGVQAGEVEIPAMAAEAGRETRQGAASDEESDGCDGAQDCNTTY
jgi:hypothetical protein